MSKLSSRELKRLKRVNHDLYVTILKTRRLQKEKMHAYVRREDVKERNRISARKYQNKPGVRARMRKYQKEYSKEYRQRPYVIARRKQLYLKKKQRVN
jgi:hypothetical protein